MRMSTKGRFAVNALIDLASAPQLRFAPHEPSWPASLSRREPVFERLKRGDLLLLASRQSNGSNDNLSREQESVRTSYDLMARELREDQPVDMDLAAAACAQVLRAHRQAARSMGLSEHTEEVMTSAGARQQVLRTVSHYPELFLVVLLDKQRTNLALARFKLMEVERSLI